jgi:hypothetical protein
VVGLVRAFATPRKTSAKIIPRHAETPHFVRSLIFEILTFRRLLRKLPRYLWWKPCRLRFWNAGDTPASRAIDQEGFAIGGRAFGVERWKFLRRQTLTNYTL